MRLLKWNIILLAFTIGTVAMAKEKIIANPIHKQHSKTNLPQHKLDTVYGTALPFLPGSVVEIKSYDAKTRTYEVHSVNFPGEDASYVSVESLARSVKSVDLNRVARAPDSVISNVYKLDRKLDSLRPEEKAARATK